jgi:hypothetical protein
MIARHWRGWTDLKKADRSEQLLGIRCFPASDAWTATEAATSCVRMVQTGELFSEVEPLANHYEVRASTI